MDLVITGTVEKFVTIRPGQVNLRGVAGDAIHSTVTITPGEKYPFKIVSSRARNGRNIRYRLQTVTKPGRPAYKLQVDNVKPDSGRYYDAIVLDTDSKIRPQVTVRVFGFLRAPRNAAKKSSSGVQ